MADPAVLLERDWDRANIENYIARVNQYISSYILATAKSRYSLTKDLGHAMLTVTDNLLQLLRQFGPLS
jgi:hypothetical protein